MIWRVIFWKSQAQNSLLNMTCMAPEMPSLSLRISWRFFVPRMFLRVVWDSNLAYYQYQYQYQWQDWPGAVMSILHVGHTHGGVADSVVDHRVHWGEESFYQHRGEIDLSRNSNWEFYWPNEPLFSLKDRQGTRQVIPWCKWNETMPETVTLSLVRTYPVSLCQRMSFNFICLIRPLVVAHPGLSFSDQLSDRTQCRASRRKYLDTLGLFRDLLATTSSDGFNWAK